MDLSFSRGGLLFSKRRDVPGTTTSGGAYNVPFFFKRWTSISKRRDAPVPIIPTLLYVLYVQLVTADDKDCVANIC